MKKNCSVFFLSFLVLFLIVSNVNSSSDAANAQSTLALQEKCTEGAKKFIERLNAPTTYTCHYNKKHDACFSRVGYYLGQIKEDVKLIDGKTMTLIHPNWMVTLYNVFDGKMIGNCAYVGTEKQECWVGNSKCKTIDEFENLIRPFMEE
jgi:hypothetical protein